MPWDVILMTTVLPSLIIATGSVAIVWLITRTILLARKGASREELDRIHRSLELIQQSMDDLRDDVHGQLDDMRDISGRVEFAERLLTRISRHEEPSPPEGVPVA